MELIVNRIVGSYRLTYINIYNYTIYNLFISILALAEYFVFDKQKYTLEEFFTDVKTFKVIQILCR